MDKNFLEAYDGLNERQKLAVDTLDGPVMVVAGPGTGKTQILTLRIANILQKTDTPANAILCLTFTRSGVMAMRERLERYIGTRSRDVIISTFHSFAISLVEKNFVLLDFDTIPQLLEDEHAILIVDELLENGDWEYLRPRTDPAKYFHDLRGLISILKRERMTPEQFLSSVEYEIKTLAEDPDSVSSRGPSKGQLKKEVEKKIESLNRTREVVAFYEQYEQFKREHSLMDYDDVLEYAVQLVQEFEDVRADVRENYHYILVDEHQDSSGVQNDFLKATWSEVERPDIFVVGDDRQLIYGFSGANLDYFTEFKTAFGKAELITLTENYRSTKPILELADTLLKSSVTNESLNSNSKLKDQEKITLSEFVYGRDEIIGAGLYFKKQIENGTSPDECALLLPKNRQVKSAVQILRSLGLPVVSEQSVSLLEIAKTKSLLRIMRLMTDPFNAVLLAESLLDSTSQVPPIDAHTFLKSVKKTDLITLQDFITYGSNDGMFAENNSVVIFGRKIESWITRFAYEKVSYIVSMIGNELLIDQAKNHDDFMESIEIVRSLLHTSMHWELKNPTGTLREFLNYFDRVNQYGNNVDVAKIGATHGIRVMTLHKSKGLEFDHVWIGHMNEEIIMSNKASAFTLPEKVKEKIAERDVLTAKRELYVAITRAKQYCMMSYAQKREIGGELELLRIIQDLPQEFLNTSSAEQNEQIILDDNPKNYISIQQIINDSPLIDTIQDFVKERFSEKKISVSLLNNFYECPWKWYFRNFLQIPEVKGVSLALGSAVHSTIEFILKIKTLPDENEIREKIIESLQKEGMVKEKDLHQLTKDAEIAISNWIKRYYSELSKNYQTERSIGFKDKQFPNLSLYGKIDLTETFPDGSVVVTDFKTGKSKTENMIEKIDEEGRMSSLLRQLAMYGFLIQGSDKVLPIELRLIFLEEDQENKNALYRTRITQEQIELLIRDIADYQELLLSGKWVNRACNAKGFGNTECEHCARMQKMLNL